MQTVKPRARQFKPFGWIVWKTPVDFDWQYGATLDDALRQWFECQLHRQTEPATALTKTR